MHLVHATKNLSDTICAFCSVAGVSAAAAGEMNALVTTALLRETAQELDFALLLGRSWQNSTSLIQLQPKI